MREVGGQACPRQVCPLGVIMREKMQYKENLEIAVAKNYSLVNKKDGRIIVNFNSKLKILECDYHVLERVLSVVGDGNLLYKVEAVFADEYSRDDVRLFLSTLLDEGLLYYVENKNEQSANPQILFIGSGDLHDMIIEHTQLHVSNIRSTPLEIFLKEPQYNFDSAVVVTEDSSLSAILELNKLLIKNEKPFLLVRYDGTCLTIGPYVFPWQTPCIECHITHHLEALNRGLKKPITVEDLTSLRFSYPIPKCYSEDQIRFLSRVITKELCQSIQENQELQFVRTEKSLLPDSYDFCNIRTYQPISACKCCHGMNQRYHSFDKKKDKKRRGAAGVEQLKIKYRAGGYRSKSAAETSALLRNAFENIGCDINIELVKDNPFASVLPVYDSKISPTFHNKTPYFFGEQYSHGKGLNKQQAYFSAAFELFERMSARYYGDSDVVVASYDEVKDCAIDIESLIKQIKNDNTPYEKFSSKKPIDWVWGTSLINEEPKLIPASMAFLTATSFHGKLFNDTSSGLAAGATLTDAILQALMELVEHDSWLIGQDNPIPLPIIDTDKIENIELLEAINSIKRMGYSVISRDYTTDIGIPTIRTWIVNPHNYTVYGTCGFGTAISAETALERSVTEAVQAACKQPPPPVTRYESPNMRDLVYNRDSLYGLYYFQQKDIKLSRTEKKKRLSEFKGNDFDSVNDILREAIKRIRDAIPNCDIVFYDLTRKAIGIPVVRVIITGDIQRMSLPLIAVSDRMFLFQKRMGYSANTPTYEELYMGPYPH